MIGKVFSCMIFVSFTFALCTGNMELLSKSVADAAEDAVTLSLSLLGLTGLWSGMIRVLESSGATKRLSRRLLPIFRLLYPTAAETGRGIEEISANFAANLLGLGNAALPLGLSAMKALTPNGNEPERIRRDLLADRCTFAVMNTVPPQLFPTTLIALRTAANAAEPYEIILPISVCSCLTVLFTAILCRLGAAFSIHRFDSLSRAFGKPKRKDLTL